METNATRATPITPEGWPGLPVARFAHEGRASHCDLQLPDSVLVLHEAGGCEVSVRQGRFAWKFGAHSGTFDFYPAGVYDSLQCDAGSTHLLLALTVPAAYERLVSQEGGWQVASAPRFQFHDRRLQRLVQTIVERASHPHPGADEVAVSLALADRLHELMAPARAADGAIGFSPVLRRLVVEHIDRHLSSPANIDRVAALSGLARTQFADAFRAAFGAPLHQYVVERRIEHAKQHLLRAQVSLAELAHRLGFASHAHFSTVFKHRVGVSPSRFRDESTR